MANYTTINISSGHSVNCRGAKGYIDEVTEAIKVVNRVSEMLKAVGVNVNKYHDTSNDVNVNLRQITNWHNSKANGIDVSVHFNAYKTTPNPIGVEVCHYGQGTGMKVAKELSSAIAVAGGFKNRGAKEKNGLYVLKNTKKTAVLIEVCFVDSKADVDLYEKNFEAICKAIVKALTGKDYKAPVQEPVQSGDGFYRVVVGSYKSKDEAIKQQAKLKEKGFDSFLVYYKA